MYDNVDQPSMHTPLQGDPPPLPCMQTPQCKAPLNAETLDADPFDPCEQTDRCNNITLPQTKIKITHEQLQILSKISSIFHGSRIALIIIRTASIDQMPTRPFY